MAWRVGIQHDPAGKRCPGAEDDPVAARGDNRPRQAQLGEAVAGARDAGNGLVGSMVEHDAGRNLSKRLEGHVEPEARPDGARRDEDVAAAQLLPLHAG